MAARDGSSKFKSIFDNVVVYHKVHGEAFADLPAPIPDAPRRPDTDPTAALRNGSRGRVTGVRKGPRPNNKG